jgi:hypothetical protein
MFTGDAEKSIATISAFSNPARQVRHASPLYFSFYLSPYNFTRALTLIIREFVVEWLEAIRQRMRGVTPRVSRGGLFPLLRAMSTVAQRELGTFIVIHEMFACVPVAYITYIGYDVVAHHAGPDVPDALSVLRHLDRRVAMIARSARDAPRPYRFVLLSDHGQTRSTPFRQRYGATIDHVVRDLLSGDRTVHAPAMRTEGWGHLNALLTEAIQHDRLSGRAARRLLRRKTHEGTVTLGRESEPGDASVVVCNSGNLSNIYFRDNPERMSLEEIANTHPGLIEGLVSHDGIAFVVVHSSQHGPVALGKSGVHHLNTGRIDGDDPLARFGAHAPAQLARLASFPHCGDVVLNGHYDAATNQVITFEEMVGTHGGLGGPQTEGFVLHPSTWPMEHDITNAEQLFGVFAGWRDDLAGGRDPGGARVDADRTDAV